MAELQGRRFGNIYFDEYATYGKTPSFFEKEYSGKWDVNTLTTLTTTSSTGKPIGEVTFKSLYDTYTSLTNGKDKALKYTVNDRVRLKKDAEDFATVDKTVYLGKEGTVTHVDNSADDDDKDDYPYTVTFSDGIYEDFNRFQLDPISTNNKETTTMSNTLNNPLQALKDLDTDADTRLLREAGFENVDGSLRSDAIEELNRREWAKIRTDVAADLRKAIANEKADKEVTTIEAKG